MGCFCFRNKEASTSINQTPVIDEEVSHIQNTQLFTYKELQLATDDFCPTNKVGQGGFGSVYKGMLKDGKVIAVKLLSAHSNQGVREFLTEIDVIAEIEHENLVKLHGCCVEGNNRILVYGYLENNSLAQTLVGERRSSLQFSWPTRTKICIGVAKGLAYLHEDIQPYIVHRDIKASNILLDKNLNPKISDFGLAKLIPANLTHVSTRVAGTAGYLAPEYALRGQLNRKADIYSFGVLLLEIVTGRSNTNRRLPIAEQYLLEKAWKMHDRGELVQLVDMDLNGDFNPDEACKYLKISLLCTQDKPKLRPQMSTVVKMLLGEIDVDDQEITKPGLLSEFMSIKVKTEQKNKHASSSGSADSDNHSSFSTGHMDNSHVCDNGMGASLLSKSSTMISRTSTAFSSLKRFRSLAATIGNCLYPTISHNSTRSSFSTRTKTKPRGLTTQTLIRPMDHQRKRFYSMVAILNIGLFLWISL